MHTIAAAALAATCLLAPARAQCAIPGRDLIVADMTSITVFGNSGGTVALMPAIALCNVGDAAANWSGSTANHPVVAFTLYRWSQVGPATRFEAIGQSWAHHQTSAVSQSLCCTCTSTGDLQHLGAGCSTVSTASASGAQQFLGVRSGVDALTGALAWPLGNPPPSSALDRRLQVAITDLATPGARYFLEAQIVSLDEQTVQTRQNDASYREVLVGAGPTFTLTGTTVRGSPAIDAWPSLDPNAAVYSFVAPGEGGAIRVASSITDLGDGFHRYEYAAHNLESTVGSRSFSVPIPNGVAVRAISFADVDTHSGDPTSDADWTLTVAPSRLTWSTSDAVTDPFANALRWGTTFRFSFEASVGPGSGFVEMLRFHPGPNDNWMVPMRVPMDIGGGGTFCAGDGSGAACPCGNASAPGDAVGCLNSFGTGGRLVRLGNASILNDTLKLSASAMPNSSALYFQGSLPQSSGAGSVLGDGLRCAAGTTIRLGTRSNVAGESSYPGPSDPPISITSGVAAGDTRYFQVWYRNAAAFCTPSTFNLTNGVITTWAP